MEMSRDREIVGGTARLAAQLPEREDRDAFQCLRHMQRPSTTDVEVEARYMRAVLGRIIGEAEEGGRQRGGRRIAGRNEPACAVAQPVAAVIGRTGNPPHTEPFPAEPAERQENDGNSVGQETGGQSSETL